MVPDPVEPDISGSVGALSATLLGAALDVAGLAVIITEARLDPPGPAICYANACFEAMSGYATAELIGRTPRILQGPDTERAELNRLRRELEARQRFIGRATNYRRNGEPFTNQWIITPIHGPDGALTHWLSIQRHGAEQALDAKALQHRTAELLGTVRAIAARTLTTPGDGAAFGNRLAALGRAQAMGATLEDILRDALDPLRPDGAQVTLLGPRLVLPPGMAEPLALALHELAANAARHGALAAPDGRLSVTWRAKGEGAARRLLLDWRERGVSPPAEAQARRGYGRQVIEEALGFALGGESRLRFEPDGMSCAIILPLAR